MFSVTPYVTVLHKHIMLSRVGFSCLFLLLMHKPRASVCQRGTYWVTSLVALLLLLSWCRTVQSRLAFNSWPLAIVCSFLFFTFSFSFLSSAKILRHYVGDLARLAKYVVFLPQPPGSWDSSACHCVNFIVSLIKNCQIRTFSASISQ